MIPANELRRLLIEAAELCENPEAIARARALPVMPELRKIGVHARTTVRLDAPETPDDLRREGVL